MGWVKSAGRLPERLVLLTAGRGDEDFGKTVEALESDKDASAIEAYWIERIKKARPALVGFTVLAFQFDYSEARWQVLVSHGSFAPVAFGCRVPEYCLMPCAQCGGNVNVQEMWSALTKNREVRVCCSKACGDKYSAPLL